MKESVGSFFHFGGVWEVGLKHHLKRVISESKYTYEDFLIILFEIQSIMNYRPLSRLSSDPENLTALTPGHFLTGRSLTALPEPDLMKFPENPLKKFQNLQLVAQHCWSRSQKKVFD